MPDRRTVHVAPATHARLVEAAHENGLPISALIGRIIEFGLDSLCGTPGCIGQAEPIGPCVECIRLGSASASEARA